MPWRTSLNGASHLNFPHLLHNLFDWLCWDSPEEGAWVPGLTFEAFNVEWRDVVVESFDENSSKEEQEEAMQAFIDIWLGKSPRSLRFSLCVLTVSTISSEGERLSGWSLLLRCVGPVN